MPAPSNARSSNFPDGPTNGLPARSSMSPGCSPTTITCAMLGPSPKTVCVPTLNRSHAWQPLDAARSLARVGRGGMKSAAEPVGFAVFLGFVMLLTVLFKAMMSTDRSAELVEVVLTLGRSLRLFTSTMPPVKLLDEFRVRLVAVLTFGLFLRPLLFALSVIHCALAV